MGIKPLVMLVDDEKPVLDVCKLFLEKAGFEVKVYDNCHSAKAAIENEEVLYNILVSDSSLSQHFEVGYICNEVIAASKEQHPSIPIISISGYNIKPDGADVHLNKPFKPEELIELIRAQLKR